MAEAERFGFTTKKVRMKTYLDFLYCKARFRCTVEEYLLFGYNRYKNSYRKYFSYELSASALFALCKRFD